MDRYWKGTGHRPKSPSPQPSPALWIWRGIEEEEKKFLKINFNAYFTSPKPVLHPRFTFRPSIAFIGYQFAQTNRNPKPTST